MKIGIVGSRTYPYLEIVKKYINTLPQDTTIISGGAIGVDTEAKNSAKANNLEYIEFLPDKTIKGHYAQKYYERNKQIVNASDMIVAFTEKESGGTWNTIKYAKAKVIPIIIISNEKSVITENLPKEQISKYKPYLYTIL